MRVVSGVSEENNVKTNCYVNALFCWTLPLISTSDSGCPIYNNVVVKAADLHYCIYKMYCIWIM